MAIGLFAGVTGATLAYTRVATVPVNTDPPGARVLVDGVDQGSVTPCAVQLRPGTHTITVKPPGLFSTSTRVVEVAWGRATVDAADPIATTPNHQVVAFKSQPEGAQFEVVDRASRQLVLRGVTPVEARVPVGQFDLRFSKPGYVDPAADDPACSSLTITGSSATRTVQRDLRPVDRSSR